MGPRSSDVLASPAATLAAARASETSAIDRSLLATVRGDGGARQMSVGCRGRGISWSASPGSPLLLAAVGCSASASTTWQMAGRRGWRLNWGRDARRHGRPLASVATGCLASGSPARPCRALASAMAVFVITRPCA